MGRGVWWASYLIQTGEKKKGSTCQCGGHSFDLWPGKIPHATEQLSPWATITEPVLLSLRATTTEAHAVRARVGSPHAAVKTQHSQKNTDFRGLPWQPTGKDSVLPPQEAGFNPWSGN